jgi:hypothetical protein
LGWLGGRSVWIAFADCLWSPPCRPPNQRAGDQGAVAVRRLVIIELGKESGKIVDRDLPLAGPFTRFPEDEPRRLRGGRIKGSHRLEGGGNRVRLSAKLKEDAIAAGLVQPWKQENACRSDTRKEYRKRALTRRAPEQSGQILLFPELSKPVARLKAFGGGIIPRPVALEIEHHRRRQGLSQRELAARIGRSQGQLANALRGHDPISSSATRRLRDLLLSVRRGDQSF